MRRILWTLVIMLCASASTLPAAAASPAPAGQMPMAGPAGPDAMLTMRNTRKCMQGCHDCWYRLFPGIVNYCLGLRDWKNGSYRSGMEFLKLAAGWGNKGAQYTLGLIYFNGHHVPADRARGIAWLMLANQRHNDAQTDLVARSAINLATAEQYQRAQQLFQKMRKRYGDKVAGVRAWRHLRRRMMWPPLKHPRTFCVLEGGGTVRWSHGSSVDPHKLCMKSGRFSKSVARIAVAYFKGLRGAVTVGPLHQVTAPAPSSTR